jgi:DnaK suppressor protein
MPKATKKAATTKAATTRTGSNKSTAAKSIAGKAAAKSAVAAKAGAAKKAPARAPAKPAPAKAAAKKAAPAKPAPARTAATKAAAAKPAPARVPAKKVAPAKPAPARAIAPAATPARASSTEFKNFEPYQTKRGEVYMNEPQREHFRAILLNWKAELMQEVDRTVSHMKDEAANFPDPADRATQEEEFSLELRTRDRERKLIKKIDSTIERIDQDDYGYCDACGVEIGIQRLEARPTASLCIDCKTLAEIKEKQELG